jgi:hypothetical protein
MPAYEAKQSLGGTMITLAPEEEFATLNGKQRNYCAAVSVVSEDNIRLKK